MGENISISETEMTVLKVLWRGPAATVREVAATLADEGYTWAYTTVQTLLNRLRDKGVVASETGGHAHVYRAVVSREGLLRARLSHLADELCDGTATPLVHALVETGKFSDSDRARFRELIAQLESESPAPDAGSKKAKRSRRTKKK